MARGNMARLPSIIALTAVLGLPLALGGCIGAVVVGGMAAAAVSPRQRRRITRATSAFLLARPELAGLVVRFDVMLVEPLRPPRHLPGVWRADE